MKSMNEAIQQYRDATIHKQRVSARRRDIEEQRAQLVSERSAIVSAIQKLRDEIQRSTRVDEIKELRRRIADLEKDDVELVGLLGEPALSPAEITDQINKAIRVVDGHRRLVFAARLAELMSSDEAAAAKAFITRMTACLRMSGADSPDLSPSQGEVAAAQRELLEWLDDAAQA